MDASDAPPQQTRSATTNRHIPAEIIEQILPNMPVQSLLRFSSASKSWNSIINEASFLEKYRGHERIIIHNPYFGEFLSCPLSAVISNNPIEIEEATNHVCPIYPCSIMGLCQGLCCAVIMKDNSLFLWNPLLPIPQNPFLQIPHCQTESSKLHYALGFDSVGDDYKLLKISYGVYREVMLYSLRSNSWRKIQSFPVIKRYISFRSCFLNGALHWLCGMSMSMSMSDYYYVIVSFDLSTEEYGEFALPPEYSPTQVHVHVQEELENEFDSGDMGEVTVLRGKLCLSLNYWKKRRFELWVIEEYGVVESWTNKFGFDCDGENIYGLRPLYICDNGQNAVYVTVIRGESWVMLMNKDGKILLRKNFGSRTIHVYVESLVSPAMFGRSCLSERSQ